jgi:hypothetical protein
LNFFLIFIESWCELQYKSGCSSTGSISHLNHSVNPEVLEKLLHEAQKESQSPLTASPPPLLAMPLIKSFDSFSAISNATTSTIGSDMTVLSKSPNSSFQEVDKMKKSTTNAVSISNNNNISTSSISAVTQSSQAIKTSAYVNVNKSMVASSSKSVASEQVFMPIKNVHQSTMFVYDDDLYCGGGDSDDSVDLEYAEEENDTNNEASSSDNNKNNGSPAGASNNTFTDTTSSQMMTRSVKEQQKKKDHVDTCTHCSKHRSEITHLLEKQIAQEKEMIRLRNEYEIKLLNKSLEISHSSSSKSKFMTSSPSPLSPPSLSSTSGITTPIYSSSSKTAANAVDGGLVETMSNQPINTKDWMKYFASRPQSQPPKEWNLVHPNHHASSAKSLRSLDEKIAPQPTSSLVGSTEYAEAANYNIMGSVKLLNGNGNGKEGMSLSKIIFTHVASFIVGATL